MIIMSFLFKIKSGAERKAALNKLTPIGYIVKPRGVLSYEQI